MASVDDDTRTIRVEVRTPSRRRELWGFPYFFALAAAVSVLGWWVVAAIVVAMVPLILWSRRSRVRAFEVAPDGALAVVRGRPAACAADDRILLHGRRDGWARLVGDHADVTVPDGDSLHEVLELRALRGALPVTRPPASEPTRLRRLIEARRTGMSLAVVLAVVGAATLVGATVATVDLFDDQRWSEAIATAGDPVVDRETGALSVELTYLVDGTEYTAPLPKGRWSMRVGDTILHSDDSLPGGSSSGGGVLIEVRDGDPTRIRNRQSDASTFGTVNALALISAWSLRGMAGVWLASRRDPDEV